jgi:hypothetical protein
MLGQPHNGSKVREAPDRAISQSGHCGIALSAASEAIEYPWQPRCFILGRFLAVFR